MSKISIMSVTDSLVGERYFIDLPLIAENPKICVESNTEFTSLTRIEIPRLLAKHITDLQSKNDRLKEKLKNSHLVRTPIQESSDE